MSEIKDTNELLEIVKTVSEMIRGEKRNSLRIECMNSLGVYGTHIKVDSKFSKWVNGLTHGSMEVPASQVYEVRTTGFSPYPQTIKGNITRSNGKLIIDLKPALKFDLFSIEIFYRMDDEFLKGLVRARSSPEPLSDQVKYELSAQLRNPEGLQLGFSEVEIEEFPISARVHIADRINMSVPDYVKDLLKIETDLLNERNPHAGMRVLELQRKKTQLLRRLGKASLTDKIKDLSLVLTPSHFINYVKTLEDFKLHQCERGTEFFHALGMLQLPKSMNVISRTDLNLKKPAAKGTMIYNSKKFDEEIADLFK